MTTLSINISRLNHLLDLYKIKVDEFLMQISKGLKTPLKREDIFTNEIKVSHLKRVDSLFNRGISYYVDESPVFRNANESIFFRKDNFNVDLNIGAVKIVDKFEREKNNILALSRLSNFSMERIIPFYKISDNPKSVASQIRKIADIHFNSSIKEFLKNIIGALSKLNIIVLEFVETHNKIEKANINGFFLTPNFIVLKRQQDFLRREVFTLCHEFGHYLLNIEEIDEVNFEETTTYNSLDKVERWCNEFAYHFLAGKYDDLLESLDTASPENDYHRALVDEISQNTHLSTLAIYTRMYTGKKIPFTSYSKVKNEIFEAYRRRQEELQIERERERELNPDTPSGGAPQPIVSPLQKEVYKSAYFEGVIDEIEFCDRLNIKPEKFETYLY